MCAHCDIVKNDIDSLFSSCSTRSSDFDVYMQADYGKNKENADSARQNNRPIIVSPSGRSN